MSYHPVCGLGSGRRRLAAGVHGAWRSRDGLYRHWGYDRLSRVRPLVICTGCAESGERGRWPGRGRDGFWDVLGSDGPPEPHALDAGPMQRDRLFFIRVSRIQIGLLSRPLVEGEKKMPTVVEVAFKPLGEIKITPCDPRALELAVDDAVVVGSA